LDPIEQMFESRGAGLCAILAGVRFGWGIWSGSKVSGRSVRFSGSIFAGFKDPPAPPDSFRGFIGCGFYGFPPLLDSAAVQLGQIVHV
jgi:hypothetical protein